MDDNVVLRGEWPQGVGGTSYRRPQIIGLGVTSTLSATLLNEARRQDVYTLLRLTRDLTPSERGALYDRVAVLRPPPSGVTRNGIMASDGAMLEAWRRTLGFPEVKHWWLHWTDALEF